MPGALNGVKVLEFSEMIAAPFAGMHLADMGADVIKVEPPDGEAWRLATPFAPGESRQFISLNRGKRGIALDLKTDEGQEIAHALARDADVVIVNYRPDTPKALGIDYETINALNPRIIYMQNTAFGMRGPHAHRPGYDLVAQAMTGLMATDNKVSDAGMPQPVAPAVADFATGITMVAAICAALYVREQTGEGQKVEASLMATALSMQTGQFLQMEAPEPAAAGLRERIREARARGASWSEIVEINQEARAVVANAYYRCYETSDGIIAIACLNPPLRRKFADAIEVRDPRHHDPDLPKTGPDAQAIALEFLGLCEARMQEKTTDEWLAVLDRAGVPAAPFRMVTELHDDPQVLDNGLVTELDHPVAGHLKMVGPLFTMGKTPPERPRSASPTIGQHNEEVLRELGYGEEAIAALRNKGVIP